MIGRPISDFWLGSPPAANGELAGGSRLSCFCGAEGEFLRKNGSRFPARGTTTPIFEDGALSGVVLEIVDLTQEKQAAAERAGLLERERAARKEAERANHLKDEFLAILSHELRTPIHAILGWVQLIRRAADPHPLLCEALPVFERNAKAQAAMISELLDVSRIVSGKIDLNIQETDMVNAVEAAVEAMRPAAESKSVQIALESPHSLPVFADPQRLEQIVSNLLSNAVKFTPSGGRVHLSVTRGSDGAELAVHDTGEGIAPEFLPYVFERFRQADGTTRRTQGGLGLGLSIVHQLVSMHGGRIRAESDGKGKGSRFTLVLPSADRAQCEPARHQDDGWALQRLAGLRVLVVDDDHDARNLLLRAFEQTGAEVFAAASAPEALALVQSRQPQVLVSDIAMPEMDGYDLIHRIRKGFGEPLASMPAVALTAFAGSDAKDNALEAGYQLHLAKPVDTGTLLSAVASLAPSPRPLGAPPHDLGLPACSGGSEPTGFIATNVARRSEK